MNNKYTNKYGFSNTDALEKLKNRKCLIGRMLETQESLNVPPEFKTAGAIYSISAACGGHSIVRDGGDYTLNLWMILIGPSGGRKSSSMLPYQGLFQHSEALKDLVLPEDMTAAGLRVPLQNNYEKFYTIHGENARTNGVFFAQEMEDFCNLKTNPDLGSFLIKFWGDQPLVKISRSNLDLELKSPNVCILSAVQTLKLTDIIPVDAWTKGFFPRMIPVYSKMNWRNDKVSYIDFDNIEEEDREGYDRLLTNYENEFIKLFQSSFICGFDKESSEYFNEKTKKLNYIPIQMSDYENRRLEHYRKISAILAISRTWNNERATRKLTKISKEDIDICFDFMNYIDGSISDLVRESIRGKNEELYNAIDELLKENNGMISKSQLKKLITHLVDVKSVNSTTDIIIREYLEIDPETAKYYKKEGTGLD